MNCNLKLFYLLLGCTPINRHTEQHDIFFCIGENLSAIKPAIISFWPDAGKIHIDCWREVTNVEGYRILVIEKIQHTQKENNLFFINLGGYLPASFEEHHHKLLTVANNMGEAVQNAKQTKFYKAYNIAHTSATSHVDNKYGVDVDEIFNVEDILPAAQKQNFSLAITKSSNLVQDEWHIGYLKLNQI